MTPVMGHTKYLTLILGTRITYCERQIIDYIYSKGRYNNIYLESVKIFVNFLQSSYSQGKPYTENTNKKGYDCLNIRY
jgi:hypothetical protein